MITEETQCVICLLVHKMGMVALECSGNESYHVYCYECYQQIAKTKTCAMCKTNPIAIKYDSYVYGQIVSCSKLPRKDMILHSYYSAILFEYIIKTYNITLEELSPVIRVIIRNQDVFKIILKAFGLSAQAAFGEDYSDYVSLISCYTTAFMFEINRHYNFTKEIYRKIYTGKNMSGLDTIKVLFQLCEFTAEEILTCHSFTYENALSFNTHVLLYAINQPDFKLDAFIQHINFVGSIDVLLALHQKFGIEAIKLIDYTSPGPSRDYLMRMKRWKN